MISRCVKDIGSATPREYDLSVAPRVDNIDNAVGTVLEEAFRLHSGWVLIDVTKVTLWPVMRRLDVDNLAEKKASLMVC